MNLCCKERRGFLSFSISLSPPIPLSPFYFFFAFIYVYLRLSDFQPMRRVVIKINSDTRRTDLIITPGSSQSGRIDRLC